MPSLKKQAISGVFWSSTQQFSAQGISFVVSIVLTRLLLPSEFGLIAMIGVFMGLGEALMNGGMGSSLIRTDKPTQEDYSTVFFFNLGSSIILYGIVFLGAPYIADFYGQEVLIAIIRWYCLIFIINAFALVQITRLTKQLDFKRQMQIAIPSSIISGGTGIGMAYAGYGVWSLVVMGVLKALISTLQLWYWAKWRPSWGFSKGKFTYHFNYGYKLTFSSLLDTLFNNAYVILIGKFFAPLQVGFYDRAETLKQLPVGNIGAILGKVTFPLFAEIKNDNVRLKSVYKKIMQLVVFLIAPLLLFMAVLAEPLFRFLFTEKWLPSVPYFQILCWNGILYPIHSYNLNILKVKGRSDLFFKLEIIKKALIVVIILISIQFGIYGLLYGSVLTSVLAFFINTHYTGKFLNYTAWEQIKDLLPTILLAFTVASLVYFLDGFIIEKTHYDIFRLMVGGLFGSSIYFGLSVIFKMNAANELMKIMKRK